MFIVIFFFIFFLFLAHVIHWNLYCHSQPSKTISFSNLCNDELLNTNCVQYHTCHCTNNEQRQITREHFENIN